MSSGKFKKAIALLFLVASVSAFGYDDDTFEEEESFLRVTEECGCEKGSMYLYSVSHDGTPQKKFLQSYGTQESCQQALKTSPPSQCR
jgi:hypothetical protein